MIFSMYNAFNCPQAFLSVSSHCRKGVSSITHMFWGREELLTPLKLPSDLFAALCTGQLNVISLVSIPFEVAF